MEQFSATSRTRQQQYEGDLAAPVQPVDCLNASIASATRTVPTASRRSMAIGASEAETFWTEFLRSLARRGLRGVRLVISDDHKGLQAAATRILGAI